MLHIRGEHDVVDYIIKHLRNRPTITEALEHDSYVYHGYVKLGVFEGYVLVVTTLLGKTRYKLGLLPGKPPEKPRILIHKEGEPNGTDASTEHTEEREAG